MSSYYAHLLNAFSLSIVLVIGLRQLSGQFGLVDIPDQRKHHLGAVPVCGGIALFAAFFVASLGLPDAIQMPWHLKLGLAVLVLLGAADDRWRLAAVARLFIQTAAAYILVHSALQGSGLNLGRLLTSDTVLLSAPLATAFAVFFIVGTINAVNMMDGIDGLAGGSAAASLFWFALVAVHAGDNTVAILSLMLLAAVIGFLVFNMRHPWRSQASVFMGDAGSVALGAALAYFVVRLASGENGIPLPVLVWLLIVPIADTLSLIARRIAARRNPLSPDRWHAHHLLVDSGVSPAAAALGLTGVTALCGGIGYLGIIAGVPDALMTAGLAIPLIVHTRLVLDTIPRRRPVGAILAVVPVDNAPPQYPRAVVGDKQ